MSPAMTAQTPVPLAALVAAGYDPEVLAKYQPNRYQLEPLLVRMEGFGPIAPESRTICSVHFREKKLSFMHSARREFKIPEVDRGKYTTMDFFASLQATFNGVNEQGVHEFIGKPVPVDAIAQDFVANWCSGSAGSTANYPPGIGLIAGRHPTKAELAFLMSRQTAYCRALVDEGDRIEKGTADKFGPQRHTQDHRDALAWLGSEKRTWAREIQLGYEKTSVVSGKRIPMEALSDGGQDLLEWYVKYDLDPVDYQDTHVAGMFENRPELKNVIRQRLNLVPVQKAPQKTQ